MKCPYSYPQLLSKIYLFMEYKRYHAISYCGQPSKTSPYPKAYCLCFLRNAQQNQKRQTKRQKN